MMTEMMFGLRRSARTLLERDGHPGPGPGRLALVMAPSGVGKTAFLVGIGIDKERNRNTCTAWTPTISTIAEAP